MIYTSLTKKAMRIAYAAHHGQVDKGGVPYIFHPIHLAEQMKDETSTCVALLHDVLEDTSVTQEELEKEFPEEVIKPLIWLTKSRTDSYEDYIRYITLDPTATIVKIADLAHNLDDTRLHRGKLSKETKNKYIRAIKFLRWGQQTENDEL